jgi:triosephosphate isomerase
MLEDCAVDVMMLGHAEYRSYMAIGPEHLYNTLHQAKPEACVLLCVSDEDQLEHILPQRLPKVLYMAYEPLDAIGGSQVASLSRIEDRIETLDASIKKRYDEPNIVWVYGGSVRQETVKPLLAIKKLQGFLVGRASLDVTQWRAIIACIQQF